MAGDGDVWVDVVPEHVVKGKLGPPELLFWRLAHALLPVRIVLREAILKHPAGKLRGDDALGASAIARVRADAFSEEFLYDGFGGEEAARIDPVSEREVGCLERADQGGDVEGLRDGDGVESSLEIPESGGFVGFGFASWGEVGVGPGRGAVTVFQGPVALWCVS